MSLRSKVAGAATAVVAPEAVAARKLTAGTSRGDVQAELQRRRQEAAARSAARRQAATTAPTGAPAGGTDTTSAPGTAEPAPASRPASAPLFSPGPMSAAHTGGGIVLGLMAWALTRAYLTGGSTGAKKFLRAKFFNETGA